MPGRPRRSERGTDDCNADQTGFSGLAGRSWGPPGSGLRICNAGLHVPGNRDKPLNRVMYATEAQEQRSRNLKIIASKRPGQEHKAAMRKHAAGLEKALRHVACL